MSGSLTSRRRRGEAIPVIALTGYLGAGKTSLLNHVLRTSGARIGVVINDFGDIIVEASGLADPVSIARIVGFSGVSGVRDGAATMVVVNRLDQVPDRDIVMQKVDDRVRERNPRAHVVGAIGGRIDSALLFDVAAARHDLGHHSFRDVLVDDTVDPVHDHVHAESVTIAGEGCVDPDALLDLLEDPPQGAPRSARRCGGRSHRRSVAVRPARLGRHA